MVETLAERFDIVIHPSSSPLADTSMVARPLQLSRFLLVSAPGVIAPIDDPMLLSNMDLIGWEYMGAQDRWHLVNDDGRTVDISVRPRLSSDNMLVMREAALAGWGVAPMSRLLCTADLAAGRLVVVAPGWGPPPATIYAVYGSRQSLSVAGRAFIDELGVYLDEVFRSV